MSEEFRLLRYLSFILLLMALLFIVLLVIYGCNDDCDPGDTRCYGETVEVCNSDMYWEKGINCNDIEDFGEEINWVCCIDPTDGIHSCLPSDECEE